MCFRPFTSLSQLLGEKVVEMELRAPSPRCFSLPETAFWKSLSIVTGLAIAPAAPEQSRLDVHRGTAFQCVMVLRCPKSYLTLEAWPFSGKVIRCVTNALIGIYIFNI